MLSRAAATRSTSMSATTSCGSAPAHATTSPSGDATRLPPTPVGAPGPEPGPVKVSAGVSLTGRENVTHRVQCPGAGQQRPLLEFAGARTPRCADGDHLGTPAGQLGVERWKANVVANSQPHPDVVDRDDDRFVSGSDRPRLRETERVIEVDLVIVVVRLIGAARAHRAHSDQRVRHPPVVRGGEHSGDHGDAGLGRDAPDTVCPGPVDQARRSVPAERRTGTWSPRGTPPASRRRRRPVRRSRAPAPDSRPDRCH